MINFAAVFICALTATAIAAIWFSPNVFGQIWMPFDRSHFKKRKAGHWPYVWVFLIYLLAAYVLAFFLRLAQATTLAQGFSIAFWSWLGFVFSTTLVGILFIGLSIRRSWFAAIYNLIVLLAMSLILVYWP